MCSAGELSVSPWDPSNLRSYLGFRAESENDPDKVIYMLYLTKEKVVYLDTFQWEEISEDLMQEAAEKTGIEQVCCDTMQYSSVELSEPYYYCPWVAAGAYMTEYEGDLKQFFTEEAKVRQTLPDIENWENFGSMELLQCILGILPYRPCVSGFKIQTRIIERSSKQG